MAHLHDSAFNQVRTWLLSVKAVNAHPKLRCGKNVYILRLPAVVEEPAGTLRLVALAVTVLLLQVADDGKYRSVLDRAASTKRFGDT